MSLQSTVIPGDYTKKELQDTLSISESTIERLRKRFALPAKEGLGRAKLIVIDENASKKINDYLIAIKTEGGTGSERFPEEVQNNVRQGSEPSLTLISEPVPKASEEVQNPFKEVEFWREKAYNFEKKNIALIGQLEKSQAVAEAEQKASHSIIEAKQSEIDTLKASLVTMEKTVQGLQASMLVLERDNQRLTPAIPMLTVSQHPKSLWDKLKFVFSPE